MITAVIIDDEEHCINRLGGIIQQHFSESISVVASCTTVSSAVATIKEVKPQLIFLDVQIHDETGFDLLKQLPRPDFEIIFTTAYDTYAVQAFKFSAIDYLLKPIDKEELQLAIEKSEDKITLTETAARLDVLFHNLSNTNITSKRICVPVAGGLMFLQVSDIIRCESKINYTTIYLTGNKKLVVSKTLKEFEDMLTAYNFFRVHNSHLVNLQYIKSYNNGKGGTVVMEDGTQVEVSTRRKDDFLKKMM
jgi:two-component system LytT family response regulator